MNECPILFPHPCGQRSGSQRRRMPSADPVVQPARRGMLDAPRRPLTAVEKRATVRGSHAPSAFWFHNNWDFKALGTIYRQHTGEDIFQSFAQCVAAPIGIKDFSPTDRGNMGYGYLWCTLNPQVSGSGAATSASSARWPRIALIVWIRWQTTRSRTRNTVAAACCSLYRYEPPLGCFADHSGVSGAVLLPLHERLHITWSA